MAIREEATYMICRQPRVSIDRQTALQPSEPKDKQVHKNRKEHWI
ncbi:MAG: hypothetical protein ACLSXO_03905 [Coprococcus sp.]